MSTSASRRKNKGDVDDMSVDYINAAQKLTEFKASLTQTVEIDEGEMDDFLAVTPTKGKPGKSKVKKQKKGTEKDKKDKKKKKKKEENEILLLTDDEDEVVEEDLEKYEQVYNEHCQAQRNRHKQVRLMQLRAFPDESSDLLAYLARNKKDADEEIEAATASASSSALMDTESSILVRWKFGVAEKLKLRRHQAFESIFQIYAKRENVPVERISLETNQGIAIYPSDTIERLKLNITDIIVGCVLQEDAEDAVQVGHVDSNDGKLEIKIQGKEKKDKLSVRMLSQEPFMCALCQISEALSIPVSQLRLHFEGDVVETNQTPDDLDLEGGEQFDLEVLKCE